MWGFVSCKVKTMGVGVGLEKLSLLSTTNLAVLAQANNKCSSSRKHVCWRSSTTPFHLQRKPISWSVLCGFMLFGLGLISLLTGHMVSDLEWYSHRRSLYSTMVSHFYFHLCLSFSQQSQCEWGVVKCFACERMFCQDGSYRAPIDVWKSQYSKYYYGCAERGRGYAREFLLHPLTTPNFVQQLQFAVFLCQNLSPLVNRLMFSLCLEHSLVFFAELELCLWTKGWTDQF